MLYCCAISKRLCSQIHLTYKSKYPWHIFGHISKDALSPQLEPDVQKKTQLLLRHQNKWADFAHPAVPSMSCLENLAGNHVPKGQLLDTELS